MNKDRELPTSLLGYRDKEEAIKLDPRVIRGKKKKGLRAGVSHGGVEARGDGGEAGDRSKDRDKYRGVSLLSAFQSPPSNGHQWSSAGVQLEQEPGQVATRSPLLCNTAEQGKG